MDDTGAVGAPEPPSVRTLGVRRVLEEARGLDPFLFCRAVIVDVELAADGFL